MDSPTVRQGVFENIPRQLSRHVDASVQRYRFKDVLAKKRSHTELAGPIQWLVSAGLALKVHICNHAALPLAAYTQPNHFKLYLFDIGLLGSMLQIPPAALIQQDYGSTKGYFAENLVAQALTRSDDTLLHAWHEGRAEIEFLKVIDDRIIPIEVKSGTRTKAKSLQTYRQKYQPAYVIKCAAQALRRDTATGLHNIPLYLAASL